MRRPRLAASVKKCTGALATLPPMPTAALTARSPRSLSGLLPFLRPYRGRIVLAGVFLLLAAGATLVFPVALRGMIDHGLGATPGARVLALREHFLLLF